MPYLQPVRWSDGFDGQTEDLTLLEIAVQCLLLKSFFAYPPHLYNLSVYREKCVLSMGSSRISPPPCEGPEGSWERGDHGPTGSNFPLLTSPSQIQNVVRAITSSNCPDAGLTEEVGSVISCPTPTTSSSSESNMFSASTEETAEVG